MTKRHIAIPILFVLVTVAIVAYHIHVLLATQETHAVEMLANQAEISGRSMQEYARAFENDLQNAVSTVDFPVFLEGDGVPHSLMIQVRRFYAKHQNIIRSIEVRDGLHSRVMKQTQENYFSFSAIRDSPQSPHEREVDLPGVEPGTVRCIRLSRRPDRECATVEVVVCPRDLIRDELRQMRVTPLFAPWCIDGDGDLVAIPALFDGSPPADAEIDGLDRIVADIGCNYRGTLRHAIAGLPSGALAVYSAYYPIQILGSRYGVVFSVVRSDWFRKTRNQIVAIIATFSVIILTMLGVFSYLLWQRAAAEQRSARSEAQAGDILAGVHVGVLIVGRESRRIRFANGVAAQMVGCTAGELVGSLVDTHIREAEAMAATEGDAVQSECRLLPRKGDGRDILKTTKRLVFRMEDCLLETFSDITEVKRQAEIARELAGRAETASRAKSEFLANMSHEIRTPLHAVIGLSQLMVRTDLDERQKQYMGRLAGSAEGLLAIIDDVLDLSKIEAEKLTIETIPFRLDQVMDRFADIVAFAAGEKGIELVFQVESGVPSAVLGDPVRLGQVLLNLGGNAVKFTEGGGEIVVRVSAAGEDGQGTMVRFSISDNGIGISDDQRAQLFQSFTQADGSTTRKHGGTGLGLVIAKRLTELMGGGIEVESELGKGSVFHFTVRLLRQAGVDGPRLPRSLDARAARVLVVDDRPAARRAVSDLFRQLGLDTEEADGGEVALDMIRGALASEPYSLLVFDWRMPGMDGLELLRRVRSLAGSGATPAVIMASPHERGQIVHQGVGLAAEAILAKPATLTSLVACVRRVFGGGNGEKPEGGGDEGGDTEAPLRGAKLLVVDDHEINREVARELLADHGIAVEMAADGAAALEALAKGTFDGVIMDIQMPVMDGYTATRRIRENVVWRDLPVIALTADAMERDRERMFEAGANDYLTKPIDIRALSAVLAKWVRPQAHAPIPLPPVGRGGDEISAPFPVLPGIDTEAGLANVQGNASLYRRLLARFAETEGDFEARFRRALVTGDAEALARIPHTLKGVAANLGVEGVQRAARSLEETCRSGAGRLELERGLDDLLPELRLVFAGLARLDADRRSADVGAASADVLLRELRQALEESDSRALEIAEGLEALLGGHAAVGSLGGVLRATKAYDFPEALRQLVVSDGAACPDL